MKNNMIVGGYYHELLCQHLKYLDEMVEDDWKVYSCFESPHTRKHQSIKMCLWDRLDCWMDIHYMKRAGFPYGVLSIKTENIIFNINVYYQYNQTRVVDCLKKLKSFPRYSKEEIVNGCLSI